MPHDPIHLASVLAQLEPRAALGHKGTFGRVTLVAGSVATPGAAILCALGALRSGVGLVRWATETATAHMAPGRPPELMLALREAMPEGTSTQAWAAHILSYSETLVIGPGLGQTASPRILFEALLRGATSPLCLDADALNLLARDATLWAHVPQQTVLTPHPREMARLCGQSVADVLSDVPDSAVRLAARTGCVVVLKGAGTCIAAPDGQVVQTSDAGISALAHGGTGDVLAGLTGGLVAQHIAPFLAAQLAVLLHRAAGEVAARQHGHTGTMASDVAHALGAVWASLGR